MSLVRRRRVNMGLVMTIAGTLLAPITLLDLLMWWIAMGLGTDTSEQWDYEYSARNPEAWILIAAGIVIVVGICVAWVCWFKSSWRRFGFWAATLSLGTSSLFLGYDAVLFAGMGLGIIN